jgi:hypothetical protein
MFRFDEKSEDDILAILDDLQRVLRLPSRGHVVEFAIRKRRVSESPGLTASSTKPPAASHSTDGRAGSTR